MLAGQMLTVGKQQMRNMELKSNGNSKNITSIKSIIKSFELGKKSYSTSHYVFDFGTLRSLGLENIKMKYVLYRQT